MGIAGCRWYLPIDGTRGSKATIATLMTPGPKAPFTYTGIYHLNQFAPEGGHDDDFKT